jgi:hypothetical protein
VKQAEITRKDMKMASNTRPITPHEREHIARIAGEIRRLKEMSLGELLERFAALFGQESRSRNHAYLRHRIAGHIQESAERNAEGKDSSSSSRQEIQRCRARGRDPRLPSPGTVLCREHEGVVHEITVLERGFLFQHREYDSLSAIAREITGTTWNGLRWVGLAGRRRR